MNKTHLNSFANRPRNTVAAALIQQIDNLSAQQARLAFDSMSGSPHAAASQIAGAIGRNFSARLATRTGSTGLSHARLSEDGFTETRAGAASLMVDARRTQDPVTSLGMTFIRPLNSGKADAGALELRAIASHLMSDNDSPLSSRLAGRAAGFPSIIHRPFTALRSSLS